jgi:hypothetical protein
MLSALVLSVAMAQTPKVEDLAWLAGNWSCEIWGGTFEENWSKPSGGTMQAMGRHIADGKTGMMEFLSLELVGGKVAMFIAVGTLSKGPQPPDRFDLIKLDGKSAVFEREKEDDFPKTISYTLKSADAMDCVLTGSQNGKEQRADFHFVRQK